MPGPRLTLLGWLLSFALVVPSCCVTAKLMPSLLDRAPRTPGLPAHGDFPVVAVVPEAGGPTAYVMYWRDLAEFQKKFPAAGFTIPEELDDRLREHRKTFYTSRPKSGTYEHSSFEVEERQPDRQRIRARFELDDDGLTVGWYDVVGGKIIPREHVAAFGPGLAMGAMFADVPILIGGTLVLWLASALLLRLLAPRLRLARPRPPAGPSG